MSFERRYLDGSLTVLVVGTGADAEGLVERLESSLSDYRIETTDSIAAATDTVTDTVGCVVTVAELPDGDGAELAAAIANGKRSPPVVLVPERVDESVALATTNGVDAIVPPGHLDRLPETVVNEAGEHVEHVADARELEALETLFDAIEDVFQIKDAEGRYLRLLSNREWPAESDALGKTDRVLHDDQFDLNERYYAEDQQVLSTGEPILGEITSYGEGPLFWLETTKVPLRDEDGEVIGLVGHIRDVTERMSHRQELEHKNQRLDRFASYVSHDLQNPLSIATGYLDLAREGDEEALGAVEDAIGRMQQLIDDIEILARGEQQMLRVGSEGTLAATKLSIATIVSNVWGVLSQGGNGGLEIELPEETVVYAGEQEFRTMIENLLKNAVIHGGEDVTVRIGATRDGFYVEDDGPGIPEAEREKVFEQGYSTAKGGTGTGLAIVSEVASAYDWTLKVTDGRDGGARFEVGNCLVVTDPDRSPSLGEPLELTDAVDVGNPGEPGHSSYDPETETWTITSAGEDIWGGENDFHFVHATFDGDVRIEARVLDIQDVFEYSKAGVMVRDSLEEDSAHGYVGFTRELIEVLWSPETGEPTTSQHLENTEDTYEWVRVDREDDRVTVAVSADGSEWFPVDQRRIAFDGPVHAGLVACSAVHRDHCEATFGNVSVKRLDGE